jgi:hypothetical protein
MHASQHHQPHALRAAMAQALVRMWPGARQLSAGEAVQPEQVQPAQPALPGLEVSDSTWAEWEAVEAAANH